MLSLARNAFELNVWQPKRKNMPTAWIDLDAGHHESLNVAVHKD